MKTKDKVVNALTKFGLMPLEEDGKVHFYYQLTLYVYIPDENDQDFVAFYIPAFYEMSDGEELEVMNVMNECNSFMKVTKLLMDKQHVSAACELFIPDDSDLECVVKRGVLALHQTKEHFEKEMKGLL